MPSFAATVVSLLVQELGSGNPSVACPKARMLALTIKELILDAEFGVVDMTRDEKLAIDEEELDPSWISSDEDSDVEEPPATLGNDHFRFGDRIVDKEDINEAIQHYRSPTKGFRSLPSMTSRFRWIKTKDHLKKLRHIEENRAKRQQQIDAIKQSLREWVLQKMEAGISLHDIDIRYQALQINRDHYKLDGFKCSPSFIQRFKKANRISSRKITRFVSKKSIVDKTKLDAAAKKFVDEVKELVRMENIPPNAIFNGDQSGFVKEQHGSRSLAPVGEKYVFRVVDSVSATTHSCTVLPQVTAAGTLRDKILVVLQERGGAPPARGHYQADNLHVYFHSTHIMTKQLMIRWLKDCVFTADLQPVSLLILDSWPAFKDHQEILKHVPRGKKVFIMNIPAGCTSKVQPLDVYFFFHIKKIMKRISGHVQLQGLNFPVHRRDNLLKCLSQVFWIVAHSRFADFLRYAWYASGYVAKPGSFETPAQYIFATDNDCSTVGCSNFAFVRCPHCQKSLCFNCFFVLVHRC